VCVRVWEGVREIERVCETVRVREREIERGVEREVNVGEMGRCRRDRGYIVGGTGGDTECVSVRWGERKTKMRGIERV
jgi:hypothetical protein